MDFPLPKKNKHLTYTPKINILHTFFAIYTVKNVKVYLIIIISRQVCSGLFYRHIMIYSKIECLNNCIVLKYQTIMLLRQHCTFFNLKKSYHFLRFFMWGFKKVQFAIFLHISWKLITWNDLDSCSFTKIETSLA